MATDTINRSADAATVFINGTALTYATPAEADAQFAAWCAQAARSSNPTMVEHGSLSVWCSTFASGASDIIVTDWTKVGLERVSLVSRRELAELVSP